MPTTREIVNEATGMFGRVPNINSGFACQVCLGPVTGFQRCFACNEIFRAGAPLPLRKAVVPMTSALNPGPWYTWLQTYKTYHRERGVVLASLVYEHLTAHASRIDAALGGPSSFFTIVPSKRGYSFADQPLRQTLALVPELEARLQQTLTFQDGASIPRRSYSPNAFAPFALSLNGARVIVIEDTWVTGATALSAAGALLQAGATTVLVLPIARLVESTFWPADHPYRLQMSSGEYDPLNPSAWPR